MWLSVILQKQRIEDGKKTFTENRKRRIAVRNERGQRRLAVDLHFEAQTRIASAAMASANIQRRKCEQLGILTGLFARSQNLAFVHPTTPLPPPIPTAPLVMSPSVCHGSTPQSPVDPSLDVAESDGPNSTSAEG